MNSSVFLGSIGGLILLAVAATNGSLLVDTCVGTSTSPTPAHLTCSGTCHDPPCSERGPLNLSGVGDVYYCGCNSPTGFPACCFMYRKKSDNTLAVTGACNGIGGCPTPPTCTLRGNGDPTPYQANCVN